MTIAERTIIVAVSGGVDSVVMLHWLAKGKREVLSHNLKEQNPAYDLVVAHVDHGMRPDSGADARFVCVLAEHYGLPFELKRLGLGPEASEETARSNRHKFLQLLGAKYGGALIATAHHQDDILETAVINLLRGTGRHGMSSLQDNDQYIRPLRDWDRQIVYDYALTHRLEWVEDETNASERFLRNRIRHHLTPVLRRKDKLKPLHEYIRWFQTHNRDMDRLLDQLLGQVSEKTTTHLALERKVFMTLHSQLQIALVHHVLRKYQVMDLDAKLIEDLRNFIHSSRPTKQFTQARPLQIKQTAEWTLFN